MVLIEFAVFGLGSALCLLSINLKTHYIDSLKIWERLYMCIVLLIIVVDDYITSIEYGHDP